MPYTAKDAAKHDKDADTPKKKRQWAHVANSMAKRLKGQKDAEARAIRAASSTVEATLYRDPEYGALAIWSDRDGLELIDHQSVDAEAARAVLEGPARGLAPELAFAMLDRRMRDGGYGDDPLGERAILRVPLAVALAPDLPAEGRAHVSEAVERAIGAHLDRAIGLVPGVVSVDTAVLEGYPRPNAESGRRLPFIRARAIVRMEEGQVTEGMRGSLDIMARDFGGDTFKLGQYKFPTQELADGFEDNVRMEYPRARTETKPARQGWMVYVSVRMGEDKIPQKRHGKATTAQGPGTEDGKRGPSKRHGKKTAVITDAFRKALEPLADALIRATAKWDPEAGRLVLEAGIAPSQVAVETFESAALPAFAPSPLQGTRAIRMVLQAPMKEVDLARLRERAASCTAAAMVEAPEPNLVAVVVPSSHGGDFFGDMAFRERVTWLEGELHDWGGQMEWIGEYRSAGELRQMLGESSRDAKHFGDLWALMHRQGDAQEYADLLAKTENHRKAGRIGDLSLKLFNLLFNAERTLG